MDSLISSDPSLFRILLVNDGSTDGSEQICQAYCREYPDLITCIHQRNQGLGAARNTGLAQVVTPYVTFLDSDDYYREGSVAAIAAAITAWPDCDIFFDIPEIYDMGSRQYSPWYDKEQLLHLFRNDQKQGINAEGVPELFSLQPSCCSRIFRTQFLLDQQFRFPVNTLWEDILPHFALLDKARSCRLIPDAGFVYRINRPGQITTSGHSNAMSLFDIYASLLSQANAWGWPAQKRRYIHQRMVDFVFWRCRASNAAMRKALLSGLRSFLLDMEPSMRSELQAPETGLQKKHRMVLGLLSGSLYPLGYLLMEGKSLFQSAAPSAPGPRRILAICNTPLQVLVITCLRRIFYTHDEFDVLLSDQLSGHKQLIQSARESGCFRSVTEVQTNAYVYETSKQPRSENPLKRIMRYVKHEKQLRQIYQGPLEYDELLLFNADAFVDLLFEALYHRNPAVQISLFEEGTPCYQHFSIAYTASRDKWESRGLLCRVADRLLNHPYPFQAMKRVYAFVPELLEGVFPFQTVRIPLLRPEPSALNELLFRIFRYDDEQDDYNARVIVFEECYLQNGQAIDYASLLKPFIDHYGKDQILVKRHPRSRHTYFEDHGFRTNRAQSIPWELVVLKHPELTRSLWVSLCCGSMICPHYIASLDYRCISLIHLLRDPVPEKTRAYFRFTQEKLMNPYPEVFQQPQTMQALCAVLSNDQSTQRRV